MTQPTPTEELIERRNALLKDVPEFEARRIPGLPFTFNRHLNAGERAERVLLAAAQSKYVETGDMQALLDFRKSLAAPQPGTTQGRPTNDGLDWVRVVATLVMVAALFIIVYVVAIKPNPVTGATQLVSLASGLAGIGLGWLFGTGTARGRNR